MSADIPTLGELRRLAEAATPEWTGSDDHEPWRLGSGDRYPSPYPTVGRPYVLGWDAAGRAHPPSVEDRRYLAAVPPRVVLALLDRLEAAEKRVFEADRLQLVSALRLPPGTPWGEAIEEAGRLWRQEQAARSECGRVYYDGHEDRVCRLPAHVAEDADPDCAEANRAAHVSVPETTADAAASARARTCASRTPDPHLETSRGHRRGMMSARSDEPAADLHRHIRRAQEKAWNEGWAAGRSVMPILRDPDSTSAAFEKATKNPYAGPGRTA